MKKHLNNLIALLITILFTVLVIHQTNFEEMIDTFKMFDIKYLIFLLPFFLLLMTLRAKRWEILLPKNDCKFIDLYEIYMTSNLINIFLPARAGDIFRGCYFGKKYGLSQLNVLGTVGAERILDGLTVLAMLLIGIILYNKSELAIQLAITAAILFICSFIIVLWIYKYNKIDDISRIIKDNKKYFPTPIREKVCNFVDKITPYLKSFIQGFDTFANPKTLFWAIIYSILSWSCDCVFIYLLILGFGIKTSFIISFFVISFIALSTIIPSSSIYIGLYQFAFIQALALFNIEKSPAISIALSQQGIMLIAYIIVSLLFVIRHHIKLSDLSKKEDK